MHNLFKQKKPFKLLLSLKGFTRFISPLLIIYSVSPQNKQYIDHHINNFTALSAGDIRPKIYDRRYTISIISSLYPCEINYLTIYSTRTKNRKTTSFRSDTIYSVKAGILAFGSF